MTSTFLQRQVRQQIRIASVTDLPHGSGRRFVSEWIEDCQMSRWLLNYFRKGGR